MPSVSEICERARGGRAVRADAARAGERVSIEREGGDVVLSTRRLDQVLEHEAGDLTAIVEAGMRVRDLNERLAEHGQMLALDPPGNPTIGACIAANLSGPRRHRYGTARDLVIGVTVVLADGTVASSGGKVVKNVAGYDLGKLFCGSEGRLGLIARVALRLHPRPEASRTLGVPGPVGGGRGRGRRGRSCARRSSSSARRRALARPAGGAVRGLAARRSTSSSRPRRSWSAARRTSGSVWEEAEARQGRAQGRLLFAPGELAATLAGLDEAVVRVSAGVAYVAGAGARPARPRRARARRARARRSSTRRGVLA